MDSSIILYSTLFRVTGVWFNVRSIFLSVLPISTERKDEWMVGKFIEVIVLSTSNSIFFEGWFVTDVKDIKDELCQLDGGIVELFRPHTWSGSFGDLMDLINVGLCLSKETSSVVGNMVFIYRYPIVLYVS